MDLTSWLEAERGRATRLAAHFRVTQSAISQWRVKGVPVAHMRAVRDFTGGDVTLEEMLPMPASAVTAEHPAPQREAA